MDVGHGLGLKPEHRDAIQRLASLVGVHSKP